MTPKNSLWVRSSLHPPRDAPLTKARAGKLAKSTITSGFSALKELSEVISQRDNIRARGPNHFEDACEQLTSRYYSWVSTAPLGQTSDMCVLQHYSTCTRSPPSTSHHHHRSLEGGLSLVFGKGSPNDSIFRRSSIFSMHSETWYVYAPRTLDRS